jgi:hypothetical protein
MPRILSKIRIDEVSAVDRSAGEGTKVVLMKRQAPSLFSRIMAKADAADDGGADDAGDRSDENTLADDSIVRLATLLVVSGGQPDLSSALYFLLHKPSGQALLAGLHKAADQKPAKESTMDSIHSIMKDGGIARVCAQIVAKGSTTISEEEIVSAVGKVAAERWPELSEAQAFSKIYTASTDEARVLQKAISIAKLSPFDIQPTMVGGVNAMHEANDSTEQSEAYRQLEAMAEKVRAARPELSAASAFANVFTDPKNAVLAAKAHRRPSPTTSYEFPR